jgi:hypothetical protein
MPGVSLTGREVAQRGERIFAERIRPNMASGDIGRFVVNNVEKWEYEIDSDHLAASDRAAARFPSSPLYTVRVGHRAGGRIGSRSPRASK